MSRQAELLEEEHVFRKHTIAEESRLKLEIFERIEREKLEFFKEVELKKALEEKVRADEIQARRIEMLDIAYNQLQVIFFINTKDVENSLESKCLTQTYR